MSDPNPSPSSAPPKPAPERFPLEELFPACFDWKQPKPLKIGIHQDLIAAGHGRQAVRRALAAYVHSRRYQKALRAGAVRVDLLGQPAGAVTQAEADHAREPRPDPSKAIPSNDTPIPKEHLVSGRLELTVKFSELPKPLRVQDGIKIGIQTGEGVVTAILPQKVWRKLEQAAKDYPSWVAALSGSLEQFAGDVITLKHPALQVFEKKPKPAPMSEAPAPAAEPSAPTAEAPASAVQRAEATLPEAASAPPYPKLTLKGRDTSKAG